LNTAGIAVEVVKRPQILANRSGKQKKNTTTQTTSDDDEDEDGDE
jgi:hypothetical protein